MSWDPRASAHVTLTDHGAILSGSDWLRALSQARDALRLSTMSYSWIGHPDSADRSACYSFGYGTAERLEQVKTLLRAVNTRFPAVHITIMTGEIRALTGDSDASMTAPDQGK